MSSNLLGADLAMMVPLIGPGQSDTACIDNALELLVIGGGYSLAHAMMMLIPEAWADPLMDPERRAFYEYHAALMEPWDGPAAIAFSDGRQIGATLDRNGLRPARYIVTDDAPLMRGRGRPSTSSSSCPARRNPRCRRCRMIRRRGSITSRPSATPRKTSSSSWSRWRATPTTRSARWGPIRRLPRSRTSQSCST